MMYFRKISKLICGTTLLLTVLFSTGAVVYGAESAKTVSAHENVDADQAKSVSLTATSCGIELVKSENSQFTFDYLGATDPDKFELSCRIAADNTLQITVDGTAAKAAAGHYMIGGGPDNYANTVRVGIPDREFETIALTLNTACISMPDFDAAVNIACEKGDISLSDTEISKGTYYIDSNSGSVSVTADRLLSQVTVESRGSCELSIGEIPTDLSLDVSGCQGRIELPDGWSDHYKTGSGLPEIKITNLGFTEITAGK